MKYFIFFILVMAGCSFKKNSYSDGKILSEMNRALSKEAIRTIQEDPAEAAIKYLESIPSESILNTSLESEIVSSALIRGETKLISYVTKRFSIYIDAGKHRNYLLNPAFASNTFGMVTTINAQLLDDLQKVEEKSISTFLKKNRIPCIALFDLTQEVRLRMAAININPNFDNFNYYFQNSEECNLANSKYKSEWMDKGVAAQFASNVYETKNFLLLTSLFNNHEYKSDLGKFIPRSSFGEIDLIGYINRKYGSELPEAGHCLEEITRISNNYYSQLDHDLSKIEDDKQKEKFLNNIDSQLMTYRQLSRTAIQRTDLALTTPSRVFP
ncbi:hypothetical protein DOM22_17425 [Bdellovibrio sp. ZAP7]|uniref:hypothetical protein n=1 Tax=Bdellovibrio sp. ZAP7 TaxID=2231053 RepID=UPI0011570594|nr:hypothetical protein [Bdellovibrio sp. ZAP7]QDK46810.1 hypothetical protein DOM22_17425 [Bdellovibrio sp. ZAP7]